MSSDKVIIVTGSSRGMGLTISQILIEKSKNVKIVLIARSEDKLIEVVNKLNSEDKARVHYIAGDLTDSKSLEKLINETISKFGKINSVIFNAGILEPIQHIEKLDLSLTRRLFEVNFFSILELTQKLIPYLKKAAIEDGIPSSCIYVSSSASEVCYDGWLAYGASKAAVNQLAMHLDNEEKTYIRAISIDPGIVDTPMQNNIRDNLGKGMKAAAHQQFIEFHQTGQLLKPEVPGGVCANLALKGIPEDLSGKYLEYCDKSLAEFQYNL